MTTAGCIDDGVFSIHWHGPTVITESKYRRDAVSLVPGDQRSADMESDITGKFLIECFASEHTDMGLSAFFTIKAHDLVQSNNTGRHRMYFIQGMYMAHTHPFSMTSPSGNTSIHRHI